MTIALLMLATSKDVHSCSIRWSTHQRPLLQLKGSISLFGHSGMFDVGKPLSATE